MLIDFDDGDLSIIHLVDEGAVVVVVEHARHNSHDIIHSKITLVAFSRFPLDRRCHHATKTRGEKERERAGKSRKRALFVESATRQRRFLAVQKKSNSFAGRRRARDRDPTKLTPFVVPTLFSANSSRKRVVVVLAPPFVGRRFFFSQNNNNNTKKHPTKKQSAIVVVGNRRETPSRDLP